jgi:hypothetical protein
MPASIGTAAAATNNGTLAGANAAAVTLSALGSPAALQRRARERRLVSSCEELGGAF